MNETFVATSSLKLRSWRRADTGRSKADAPFSIQISAEFCGVPYGFRLQPAENRIYEGRYGSHRVGELLQETAT
jgi:hypothetical protein